MWQTEATTTFTTHLLSLKSWENAIFAIYLLQAKRVSQIFVYTLHLPNRTNAKKTRPLPTLSSLQIWCKYVIWIEVNVTKVVRMRPLIHICNRFVTPVNPFFRPVTLGMEWHQEKLLALCRICGLKIKDHKRKVHASKLSAEVNKVWQVSFLVDSPSVHPSFICVKCGQTGFAPMFNMRPFTSKYQLIECKTVIFKTQPL